MTKQELEKMYKGKTIKILRMEGFEEDNRHYAGKTGVVNYADDAMGLHGTWGGLAVLADVDEFTIVE